MTNANLNTIQQAIQASGFDGWLFYDFRGLNPFPKQILNLGDGILTRRWFLFVPASGTPSLIHHRIETVTWEKLLPEISILRKAFASQAQMTSLLQETLGQVGRVAMEFSPMGEVPYVSCVDVGTAELIRSFGVELCSSADVLQHFLTWNNEDRVAHEKAVECVVQAKDAAFRLIHQQLLAGNAVTEVQVQDQIVAYLTGQGLEFDHPPIVAFGSHASDGHYAPNLETDRTLEMGQCVLVDLWAGFKDRPMADITWVGFAGKPSPEYLHVWDTVCAARDLAVHLLTTRAVKAGWEVDRAARDLIASRGYGAAFRHRLGHSLGRNHPHGQSVNLDDWETHDTRQLLPGLAVTVEPGVYLGHIGVRSEVNVLLTESGAVVTTPMQIEPYQLGI